MNPAELFRFDLMTIFLTLTHLLFLVPHFSPEVASCVQDALPVVWDMQLRAIEQPISRSRRALKVPGIGDDSGAHFSREYMTQLVLEVQQALASAGMDGAARQAEGLLLSNSPEAAPAQPAVPEGSAAETSSSVDILASELHPPACLEHVCLVHKAACLKACVCIVVQSHKVCCRRMQAPAAARLALPLPLPLKGLTCHDASSCKLKRVSQLPQPSPTAAVRAAPSTAWLPVKALHVPVAECPSGQQAPKPKAACSTWPRRSASRVWISQ